MGILQSNDQDATMQDMLTSHPLPYDLSTMQSAPIRF